MPFTESLFTLPRSSILFFFPVSLFNSDISSVSNFFTQSSTYISLIRWSGDGFVTSKRVQWHFYLTPPPHIFIASKNNDCAPREYWGSTRSQVLQNLLLFMPFMPWMMTKNLDFPEAAVSSSSLCAVVTIIKGTHAAGRTTGIQPQPMRFWASLRSTASPNQLLRIHT